MTNQTHMLATTMIEAFRALDPAKPLEKGDPRYEDLAEARGDASTTRLRRQFEFVDQGQFAHVALISHRGAGKTTELKILQKELENRYYSIYVETNVELDANAFEIEDLFLNLAHLIGTKFSTSKHVQKSLAQVETWFTKVIDSTKVGNQFSGEIRTEAEASTTIPFIMKLMGKVVALAKVESEHRTEIRKELKRYPGALLDSLNSLLEAARSELLTEGKELLIILDNLDRYNPEVIDEVLIQNRDRLQQLKCHLILTPPISLEHRPVTDRLGDVFYCIQMSTPNLRDRKDKISTLKELPKRHLLEILKKRLDVNKLIPGEHMQERLIKASGGAIRTLLEITREAFVLAKSDTLQMSEIEDAIRIKKRELRDFMLIHRMEEELVRVYQTKRPSDSISFKDALYHRLVFYYNGDGWYDVHPLIVETPEFIAAASTMGVELI